MLITDFFSKADEMHESEHDPEGLTDSLVSLKIQKGKWTPVRRRTTKKLHRKLSHIPFSLQLQETVIKSRQKKEVFYKKVECKYIHYSV